MLTNYLRPAWRHLKSHRNFTLINTIGLAIGIAACILISLSVSYERSFDTFIPDRAHVYRINEYAHYPGTPPYIAGNIGAPIAPFLAADHPEIQRFARVIPSSWIYPSTTLVNAGNSIKTSQLVCTDTGFAGLFGLKFLEGEKAGYVRTINTIVLTKSLARRLFGNESALNRTLTLKTDDSTHFPVAVSGVIEDLPATSHFQAEAMMPIPKSWDTGWAGKNWGMFPAAVYARIKPGVDPKKLEAQLTTTVHKGNKGIDIRLQPLADIHAGSMDIQIDPFNFQKIDGKYLRVFVIIGLSIFVIACCNFVNLTIALAAWRGKEVAVKKIMGARRLQLMLQVLAEAFLSTAIAIVLSIGLVTLFLPSLNHLLGRELRLDSLEKWPIPGIYAAILIAATLFAGLYPAILISSAKAQQALRSKVLIGGSRTALRNILVTGQFAIAIVFIVCLVVFTRQLDYMQNKDLGYTHEQLFHVRLEGRDQQKASLFRNEIAKLPGVRDVASGLIELGVTGGTFGVDYIAPNGEKKHEVFNYENGTPNYIKFFGIRLLAGREFTPVKPHNEYIINETLAKHLGFADPIGKTIGVTSFDPGVIVGVVKDFNFSTLHQKIEPLLIGCTDYVPLWQRELYIKVATGHLPQTLKAINATLQSLSIEDNRLTGQFLDEHFRQTYKADRQAQTMIAVIGALAILIAALGLFGLAAFIMAKRTKEISIRKVLGASIGNVIANLSSSFFALIGVAFLVAAPIAWIIANSWLQGFAYRVTVQWWMFALAGVLAAGIAVLIVGFLALKAAGANPVNSLRTE
ncbi:MAG TPA: ABC transporter permease [Puia sp.]|uniref:ABC transporter permease n=1 Tax=Puia sp. TaxID=2045100 RepID=UPI002C47F86A|nr:ABC transporter permease [Puia sp.]HVU99626.1 ABC transporter permease [Puia sp.]